MKINNKTKKQLIKELAQLQKRIAELEKAQAHSKPKIKALQKSEKILRNTVLGLPISVFSVDHKGIFKLSEGKGLEILNIFPQRVLGKSVYKLLRNYPKILEKIRSVLDGKDIETIIDIDDLAVQFRCSPVIKTDGKIKGAIGVVIDITKYRKVERTLEAANQQLRASEQQLRVSNQQLRANEEQMRGSKRQIDFILGVTRTGLDIIDSEYNIRYIDTEWQKVYGEPADKKCYEYFMDRSQVCPGCGVKKALEIKQVTVTERVLVKEKNRLIQVTSIPFQNDKGEWLVAAINVDITKRKKIESALRESKQSLQAIFDNATDGILLADAETKKLFAGNKSLCQMLGYSLEEIVNLEIKDIHPKQELPYIIEQFEKQLRKEISLATDILVKRKDGSVFYADINSGPVIIAGKVYLLGIFRNITERKKAELELKQAYEKLKETQDMLIQSEKLASLGELVSAMAHEVNNPLMVISGRAQLSLMENLKHEEIEKNLKIIEEQCQRAKDIIERLLMFSRPSKGEIKKVNINEVLHLVINLLEHQYSLRDIKIMVNYTSSLPKITIDEKQMQEIFMNLMNNSADAMPGGGVITVSTSREADFIRIDFKDTGCGISEEDLPKIFDPFFTTKEQGTGLGLSICYGIIKAHNGELKYKSKTGSGTTATILLPLGDET